MNAEEAYKLANENANVEGTITLVKEAASKGEYGVVVPRLSDAQVKQLTALGYSVTAEWESGAIVGSRRDNDCKYHRISWFKFGLQGNLNALLGK